MPQHIKTLRTQKQESAETEVVSNGLTFPTEATEVVDKCVGRNKTWHHKTVHQARK